MAEGVEGLEKASGDWPDIPLVGAIAVDGDDPRIWKRLPEVDGVGLQPSIAADGEQSREGRAKSAVVRDPKFVCAMEPDVRRIADPSFPAIPPPEKLGVVRREPDPERALEITQSILGQAGTFPVCGLQACEILVGHIGKSTDAQITQRSLMSPDPWPPCGHYRGPEKCANVTRSAAYLALVLAVASACSREPLDDTVDLPGPTAPVTECAGVGGPLGEMVILRGDPNDPHLTWETALDGSGRQDVIWPPQYRGRFAPKLEVFDAKGGLIARDGDRVPGGGCVVGSLDVLLILPEEWAK